MAITDFVNAKVDSQLKLFVMESLTSWYLTAIDWCLTKRKRVFLIDVLSKTLPTCHKKILEAPEYNQYQLFNSAFDEKIEHRQ